MHARINHSYSIPAEGFTLNLKHERKVDPICLAELHLHEASTKQSIKLGFNSTSMLLYLLRVCAYLHPPREKMLPLFLEKFVGFQT